ncbi:hypothetical protein [Azospirillum tabaci]|uniref:hypothetical protein n=1 Tax=Azospirillum tabaci TaxID=2752310 RepID=UPI0016617BC3|nr:hypothetical protein [Azospirillum tabaci]
MMSKEARIIERIRQDVVEPEDAMAALSTSEYLCVALGINRLDLLPSRFPDFESAWHRLDDVQRSIVLFYVSPPGSVYRKDDWGASRC